VRAPRIVRAENDRLFDADGRAYVDLFSAHGAAWLGHRPPAVEARLREQLARVWVLGRLPTPVLDEAAERLSSLFPRTHATCALYSTGMEAAEFALRLARVATGRREVVGFASSMHGKSRATAALGWDDPLGATLPDAHRLPFPSRTPEDGVLAALEERLATRRVAAVFVEPVQGSGGGHVASPEFLRAVARACAASGALLVFDEILTGLHRTGPRFCFDALGFVPDVVLVGKGLGSGFPVSAVVADVRHRIVPAMLPWSTFAGNPLAAAAVAATLEALPALDLPSRVRTIEAAIRDGLAPLAGTGVELRGRGALQVLDLPEAAPVEAIVTRVFERGVALGFTGRQIRILPAATIDPGRLAAAVAVVADEVAKACTERAAPAGGEGA
jgi:acetylornithine/succinyldiaminopimelate/putrescine aminotransferase